MDFLYSRNLLRSARGRTPRETPPGPACDRRDPQAPDPYRSYVGSVRGPRCRTWRADGRVRRARPTRRGTPRPASGQVSRVGTRQGVLGERFGLSRDDYGAGEQDHDVITALAPVLGVGYSWVI